MANDQEKDPKRCHELREESQRLKRDQERAERKNASFERRRANQKKDLERLQRRLADINRQIAQASQDAIGSGLDMSLIEVEAAIARIAIGQRDNRDVLSQTWRI